ncbi:MAG: SoxR reducing system RseC family protein [bacterium]
MALAKVEEINDGKITILMNEPEGCEDCDSLACSVAGRRRVTVKNPAGLELKPGDTIHVTPREGIMWGAAFILFVLPLAFFAGGTYLGHNYGDLLRLPFAPELNGIICGILLLLICLPLIRKFGKKYIGEGETLEIKKF